MKDKEVLKKLSIIGVALIITSYIANYYNIGFKIPGINTFNYNPFISVILWSALFSIKIGAYISILFIFMEFKRLNLLTFAPCILILDISNMLTEGCNLFILISSIYFVVIIFYILKLKMIKKNLGI